MKYKCPYCESDNTSLLPGGVVVECLEKTCGWTFNKQQSVSRSKFKERAVKKSLRVYLPKKVNVDSIIIEASGLSLDELLQSIKYKTTSLDIPGEFKRLKLRMVGDQKIIETICENIWRVYGKRKGNR